MRLRILGSSTSLGVPVIGCRCAVCTSPDKRNFRTRTSAVFEHDDKTLLIDTSTDFRFQAIWYNVKTVDAVCLTHAHADHISGLDDLRVFNFRQQQAIPIYGNKDTIEQVRKRFGYIFEPTQQGGGKPQIDLRILDGPFKAASMDVIPIPLLHGELETLGFRVGKAAYVTDVSRIPDSSIKMLTGLDVMVLDALRRKPHPTHFSLDQALEVIRELKPKRAILTHLTHGFDHQALLDELPENVEPAYDGLTVQL